MTDYGNVSDILRCVVLQAFVPPMISFPLHNFLYASNEGLSYGFSTAALEFLSYKKDFL